jgi:adenylate cyclase
MGLVMTRLSKTRRSARKAPGRKASKAKRISSTKAARGKQVSVSNFREQLNRRTAELVEARAQQTATADVLKIISRSAFDLQTVLQTLVESAARLCGADKAQILRPRDGQRFYAAASHGHTPEFNEHLSTLTFGPGDGVLGRVLSKGEPVQIADVLADPDYRLLETQRLGGFRTHLGVPLLREGNPVGILIVSRVTVRPFDDKQIELLTTFADQAVIAIQNVKLFDEVQAKSRDLEEALQFQTASADVLKVISRSPDTLQPVLDVIVDTSWRLCGSEASTFFILRDGEFHLAAIAGSLPGHLDHLRANPVAVDQKGSSVARAVREKRTIHVPNTAEDPERTYGNFAAGAPRALLSVPLLRDGQAIGCISLRQSRLKAFTPRQIEVVETFADQAVIAVENARLFEEVQARTRDLSESLEQQTATAEVLQVISSSTGDVEPVFQKLLENATLVCGAQFGAMNLLEDGQARNVALHNMPSAYASVRLAKRLFRPHPEGPLGKSIRTKQVVQIEDLRTSPAYLERNPAVVELADIGGARTVVSVPMLRVDGLIGVINIYRQEVLPFSDKQIELLKNFASQAVIAIENTRLLKELRQRTDQVAELNRGLETRVAEQVEKLGRVGRLKRFLAPQLAELIVSQANEKILESHRSEIVVVFCDLRGYTAFTEKAEPEEVLGFLREYHGALGPLVSQFEGTLDQFSGDGIMVFFNDPVPIPDPAERAVKMAVAMREAASSLTAAWRERGRELGFGAGIAQGYATLGQIGFSERSGYTAIGTVCNVAARLCGEAKDGQILLGQRVNVALKGSVATEHLGALVLKGLTQPVVTYNVPLTAIQPALRVIDGGNH